MTEQAARPEMTGPGSGPGSGEIGLADALGDDIGVMAPGPDTTPSSGSHPGQSRADPGPEWQADPVIVTIQRRTVRMLVAAQVVGGVGIGAGASLGALLAEQVTNSESMAGLARTCTTLGAAAIALPLAMLARRRGRNTALGLGWTIAAIGGVVLVVSAVTVNVPLLIIGMLMFGCGTAVNLQSRYAAIDLARPARRGKTLALVVWSTTIGSVVGPNLASPGADVAGWFGLPDLSGGFLISAVVLVFGALAMFVFMRPDPLLTAQRISGSGATIAQRKQRSLAVTARAVRASPLTRFALVTVVVGHTVMAAVMTMTPVHMMDHGADLTLVGMTISVHVLGMYAFSPLVGWLSDRIGAIRTIVIGQGLFVVAAIAAGLSGSSTALVTLGLLLLGLGWSFSLVAGSTLLAESVPETIRPAVQGTSDMAMNVMAAVAAGVSGLIQDGIGFGGLNAVAGILTIPVLLLFLGLSRHRG